MKRFKDAYFYLFYKFYKFSEAAPSKWMSHWKAGLLIDVLEVFIGLSAVVYYTVFSKQWIDFGDRKEVGFLYLLFIAVPNYFIFHHKDRWKDIVKKFDRMPQKKNKIGSWIVFCFVILVVANLIFAFYLMSQIDWELYK
jgi:hypothetical protein